MNTKGPLDLSREDALKIERAILALQPFHAESWEDAVENYLILRWVLGLGSASVREIVVALKQAKFRFSTWRTHKSCRSTVHKIFYWNDKFRVTDSSQLRDIPNKPRQYAWRPNPKSND